MTREKAIKKALSLSMRGEARVSETEEYFTRDNGEQGYYHNHFVAIDNISSGPHPSYEECFDDLETTMVSRREAKKAELRAELARLEAGEEK